MKFVVKPTLSWMDSHHKGSVMWRVVRFIDNLNKLLNKTVELVVIWGAMAFMWRQCYVLFRFLLAGGLLRYAHL